MGELVLDCGCPEGIRPHDKIIEGYRCRCKVYYREKGKSHDTGTEVQIGVVTVDLKRWKP